jgi:uncharacterized protein YijF (DUF1287 family)
MKHYLKSFIAIIAQGLLPLCINVSLASNPSAVLPQRLIEAAHKQIGVTCSYDPAYTTLKYPGGDVPLERGVCTYVIIRSLRDQGIDLQKNINERMRKNWSLYPKKWGLSKPDSNIDHRRIPNIMTYLKFMKCAVSIDALKNPYGPGDIVVWDLGRGVLHIGLVSDYQVKNQARYMVIHNIGRGVQEEDILASYKIVAHFQLGGKSLIS